MEPGGSGHFPAQNHAAEAAEADKTKEDLVGEPYAVVESDPGVFTSIIRRLGVLGVEVKEVVSIDADGIGHMKPHGLIFCFKWQRDAHPEEDYDDGDDYEEDARPWFANQLSDDSCATLAIMNVLLNCEEVELGSLLEGFKDFTNDFDPVMRGLAIAQSTKLREAHNYMARPADLRASLSSVTTATLKAAKQNKSAPKIAAVKRQRKSLLLPKPKAKGDGKQMGKKANDDDNVSESYHFIAYLPYKGRVWELDGLKHGPLDCAELEDPQSDWVDAVRPALSGKMAAYSAAGDIRFNLLALVKDNYQLRSDALELTRREINALERRLTELFDRDWKIQVDGSLLSEKNDILQSVQSEQLGRGFGAQANETVCKVLELPMEDLLPTWEAAARRLLTQKLALDDEINKERGLSAEQIKRTHDYTPFIQQYITKVYHAGFLHDLLEIDENGKPLKSSRSKT